MTSLRFVARKLNNIDKNINFYQEMKKIVDN